MAFDVGGETPETQTQPVREPTKLEKHNAQQKLAKQKSDARKAEYQKIKGTPGMVDLVASVQSMSALHTRVAKDGVGYKKNPDGSADEVKLTSEERLRELDRAAGQDEILDMLERQFS